MDLLEESTKLISQIRQDYPEIVNAYLNFTVKAKKSNAINVKHKSLILLALALYSQCEACIMIHVQNAVEEGATREEIIEACMMAVVMGGSPKLINMRVVYQELKQIFD